MLPFRALELVEPYGEYAGRLLCDMGFTVTKVESPGRGSPSRHQAPCLRSRAQPRQAAVGFRHLFYNADKRSVTLDVDDPTGRALLDQLLERSDVVLQTRNAGLSADEVHARHPHLVVVRLLGFPESGPLAGAPELDLLLFAAGGLMYVSGEPDGEPVVAPYEQSYVVGGVHGALAAVAALLARRRGGPGQVVDVVYQAALAAQELTVAEYLGLGSNTRRSGSQHRTSVPGRIYACKDGFVHFMVSVAQAGSWDRFLSWIGNPPELTVPEYRQVMYRREHAAEVDRVVSRCFRDRTRAEIVDSAQESHIPCAPVFSVAEACEDPHLVQRGLMGWATGSGLGRVPFPAPGLRVPWNWPRTIRCAPELGQHNREVYCGELGIADEEFDALRAHGIV